MDFNIKRRAQDICFVCEQSRVWLSGFIFLKVLERKLALRDLNLTVSKKNGQRNWLIQLGWIDAYGTYMRDEGTRNAYLPGRGQRFNWEETYV